MLQYIRSASNLTEVLIQLTDTSHATSWWGQGHTLFLANWKVPERCMRESVSTWTGNDLQSIVFSSSVGRFAENEKALKVRSTRRKALQSASCHPKQTLVDDDVWRERRRPQVIHISCLILKHMERYSQCCTGDWNPSSCILPLLQPANPARCYYSKLCRALDSTWLTAHALWTTMVVFTTWVNTDIETVTAQSQSNMYTQLPCRS